jgi:uracil-DNA glycosylase
MAVDLTAFWSALEATPCPADADADADALYFADARDDGSDDSSRITLRRTNLTRYLSWCAEAGAHTMLVAEAPGWRGMTNTGVPFMSVREIEADPSLGLSLPDAPTAVWEASSRVVQAALQGLDVPPPVCWPVYPHHPHVAGNPLTNRTPRPAEVRSGLPAVRALLDAFEIRSIVAVGRKAEGALQSVGIPATAVRHPAQGGARLFTEQTRALLAG